MKKVLILLLVVSILVFGYSSIFKGAELTKGLSFDKSVCDVPLTYRLGTVDDRFKFTDKELRADLAQGENIWETQINKNLFAYDEAAELQVEFVYDRKQALNSQINDLSGKLDSDRGDLEGKKAQFLADVSQFEKEIEDLNNQIKFWNNQGGASPEEYDKLNARKNELKSKGAGLQASATELNLSSAQFNEELGVLNENISEFNKDLAKRPEEGLYDPETKTIYIYFVPSEAELVHTLAHEMGHALGLSHVDGAESSIMYPFSSESRSLSNEDISAINSVCRDRSVVERLTKNLFIISERFNHGLAQD